MLVPATHLDECADGLFSVDTIERQVFLLTEIAKVKWMGHNGLLHVKAKGLAIFVACRSSHGGLAGPCQEIRSHMIAFSPFYGPVAEIILELRQAYGLLLEDGVLVG
jgi:hypothetical protein